ncbi:MAG: hypothetical protein KDC24_00520 [Saprospiraceae bacterium]|nr:hypothetical protein [Saprospiraceae bacterium]
MRTTIFGIIATLSIVFANVTIAQTITQNTLVTVLDIETKGFNLTPSQMGDIVRTELIKIKVMEVMDPYDVQYLMEKNDIQVENCYGKMCLTELGKKLNSDKMLTGSVEVYGERIIVNLRLIDVGLESVEKAHVEEFLNLRNEVTSMVGITLKKMFDQEVDQTLYTTLTKKFDYENAINTPEVNRLNLSGPRMGVMAATGDLGKVFQAEKSEGGYDLYPVIFQFGYQFEVKYLNQGDFQALFEFVPIISGLDQGRFIPSFSLLNGLRSNKSGFEFAFGPIFYMTKKASGYYNAEGNWILEDDYVHVPNTTAPNFEERLDSRGSINVASRFVFSVGKTFKSGTLNLPVNAFFIPSKDGHRIGLSVGYNASKR